MTGAELRIGVVLEAFLDWPLERVLPWLREAAPEVTDIEVGAGGYAPHPHCDVAALLHSPAARTAWLDQLARHGIRLDALNAWGNPLHPVKWPVKEGLEHHAYPQLCPCHVPSLSRWLMTCQETVSMSGQSEQSPGRNDIDTPILGPVTRSR